MSNKLVEKAKRIKAELALKAEKEEKEKQIKTTLTALDGTKIGKVKDLFRYRVITDAMILPQPMSDGWLLQFRDTESKLLTLETDRGKIRVFKTIDAAFKTAQEIGFQSVKVSKRIRK